MSSQNEIQRLTGIVDQSTAYINDIEIRLQQEKQMLKREKLDKQQQALQFKNILSNMQKKQGRVR